MTPTADNTQEPRNETVTVACTAHEKSAVKAVAAALEIPVSEVLRTRTMDEVMHQYGRIRAAVTDAA